MAQIGDILAKLGRMEALTTTEQQAVRLWGNALEQKGAFIDGLQNGRSNIISADISAERLYVGKEIVSGTAGRYYELDLSVATSTYVGTAAWTKLYADAGFSTAFTTGQDNVVIPESGRYQVSIQVNWNNTVSTAGIRDSGLSINDIARSPQNNTLVATGAFNTYLYGIDEVNLSKGDELHLTHWQNSGSTLTVRTTMSVRKIR